jgi:nicotinamidase/pyrazinamidase
MTHLPTGERRKTGLEQFLRDRGVGHVVIAGLATDYCVKETGLDAVEMGFDTEVITDATRPVEVETGDGARALHDLEQAGVRLV